MYYQTAYFDSRTAVIHGMEFCGGQLFFSFFPCIYLTYISPFIRRRKIGNVHPVPLGPSRSNHYCNGQSETSYFNIHLPVPFPFFFSHLPRTRVLLPLAFTDPKNQSFLSSIIPFLCSNNAKERAAKAQTESIPCNYLAFNGIIELSQRGANFTIRMWNITNRNRTSRRCAPLIRVANGPSGSTSVPDAGENCTGTLASQLELSGWTLNSQLMHPFRKITPARD